MRGRASAGTLPNRNSNGVGRLYRESGNLRGAQPSPPRHYDASRHGVAGNNAHGYNHTHRKPGRQ